MSTNLNKFVKGITLNLNISLWISKWCVTYICLLLRLLLPRPTGRRPPQPPWLVLVPQRYVDFNQRVDVDDRTFSVLRTVFSCAYFRFYHHHHYNNVTWGLVWGNRLQMQSRLTRIGQPLNRSFWCREDVQSAAGNCNSVAGNGHCNLSGRT